MVYYFYICDIIYIFLYYVAFVCIYIYNIQCIYTLFVHVQKHVLYIYTYTASCRERSCWCVRSGKGVCFAPVLDTPKIGISK